MTVKELCEVFSREIGKSFDLSKEQIAEQMFYGTTEDMTEAEIYSNMIINSIVLSANLSAQVMVTGLVNMGVIPKDALEKAKLKPDIHLLNAPESPVSTDGRKVKKTEKKIKVVKQLTDEQRGKIIERLDKNKPL